MSDQENQQQEVEREFEDSNDNPRSRNEDDENKTEEVEVEQAPTEARTEPAQSRMQTTTPDDSEDDEPSMRTLLKSIDEKMTKGLKTMKEDLIDMNNATQISMQDEMRKGLRSINEEIQTIKVNMEEELHHQGLLMREQQEIQMEEIPRKRTTFKDEEETFPTNLTRSKKRTENLEKRKSLNKLSLPLQGNGREITTPLDKKGEAKPIIYREPSKPFKFGGAKTSMLIEWYEHMRNHISLTLTGWEKEVREIFDNLDEIVKIPKTLDETLYSIMYMHTSGTARTLVLNSNRSGLKSLKKLVKYFTPEDNQIQQTVINMLETFDWKKNLSIWQNYNYFLKLVEESNNIGYLPDNTVVINNFCGKMPNDGNSNFSLPDRLQIQLLKANCESIEAFTNSLKRYLTAIHGQKAIHLKTSTRTKMEKPYKNTKTNETNFANNSSERRPAMNQQKSKFSPKCWACGEKGHTTRDCQASTKERTIYTEAQLSRVQERLNKLKASTNLVETNFTSVGQQAYVIDSGATKSIVNSLENLYNVRKHTEKIQVAKEGTYIMSKSIGTLLLPVTSIDGKSLDIEIPETIYAPKCGRNLLSTKDLQENGINFGKHGDTWMISPQKDVIAMENLPNGLVTLPVKKRPQRIEAYTARSFVTPQWVKGYKSNDWTYPKEEYEDLNKIFQFQLDAHASEENSLCDNFYSKDDKLEDHDLKNEEWTSIFMNPSYDGGTEKIACAIFQLQDWVTETGNTAVVIAPIYKGASYMKLRENCVILKSYKKGEVLFANPREAKRQPLRWDVEAWLLRPSTTEKGTRAHEDALKLHKRYGHLSLEKLRRLVEIPQMVKKLPFCSNCSRGKAKASIVHTAPRPHSDRPGDYIYRDWKKMPRTFNAYEGYTSYIDDCTNYTYVDPMRSKSDQINSLKKYLAQHIRPQMLGGDAEPVLNSAVFPVSVTQSCSWKIAHAIFSVPPS